MQAQRKQLVKQHQPAPTTITSYNVANCPSGKPRGALRVATAPDLTGLTTPLG